MKKVLLSLSLLFFFALSSIAQSNVDQSDWETFKKEGYQIQYPSDWTLSQNGEMGTKFVLMSPRDDENDAFSENVNLIAQDLGGQKISMDDYVALSQKQIETLITDSEILSSERLSIDEGECHKIIYSGKTGKLSLKFEQYYLIIKGKAYVLTLTCAQEDFDRFQKVGEAILKSFKIN